MNYELSFLMPVLDQDERDSLLKEVEEKIKKLNGKLDDRFIEKKFFAYPVKKHQEGFLAQVNFSLEKDEIKSLQEYIKKKKKILRTLLEKRRKIERAPKERRRKVGPILKKPPKKEKVKIEELDKKLEEILK